MLKRDKGYDSMTAENFIFWLQGFMEIANPEIITKEQIQEIRNHISLVLQKVTPQVVYPNSLNLLNMAKQKNEFAYGFPMNDITPIASC